MFSVYIYFPSFYSVSPLSFCIMFSYFPFSLWFFIVFTNFLLIYPFRYAKLYILNLLWRYFKVNNTESTRLKNFRNALGGYNKEDVNQYIKEIDLAFSAREQEWTDKLNALTEELNALNASKISMEEELNAVKEQRADAIQKLDAQNAEIEDLRKHVGIYKDQSEAQNVLIESLKKETAEAKERLSAAEARTAEVQKQLEENAAKNTELAQAQESLTASLEDYKQRWYTSVEECEVLKTKYAEAENRMQTVQADLESAVSEERTRAAEEIRSLQENITAENENTAYKLEMYDKISAQIGDILINANRNADEILSAAKEEAEKIRTDAALEAEMLRSDTNTEVTRIRSETEEEANYIRERLSDTANQLLSQISGDMHGNIDNCIKEVNTCIQEMQYDTEHMLNVLKSRYHEMNERIQYYQSCVTESVTQKLQDMDEKYGIRQANIRSENSQAE